MRAGTRRKLEMAARAHSFCRAHPYDDPSYELVLKQFEETLARAESLTATQRVGRASGIEATKRRIALKGTLQRHLLPYLAGVAHTAMGTSPELAGKFKVPPITAANQSFANAARSMLAEGQARREVLIGHGMAATLLDDIAATITELEHATEASYLARRDRIQARGALEEMDSAITSMVVVLDGMNRYRFRNEPERLLAWNNASNVENPVRQRPGTPEAPSGPEAPPAPGASKAA